ncbi:DUF2812 domain-containing protein [Eubacteriaceae bacterium ES2]|nr:DUF2812 domain-containing protein [Eubacteriaceae bacterium ES2]
MKERKTIYKWIWAWDFEKEEQWLNEMAKSGWALCAVGFCRYTFEKSEPGEYVIRLEMHAVDDAYINFMSETGALYIGRIFQWIYFRKNTEDGLFDIFSDIDSRINHLDKMGKMMAMIGFANILIGFANAFDPIHIGVINLLVATLIMYGLGRIYGKKEALEKERQLYE